MATKKISNLNEDQKKLLLSKSPYVLPDNPSDKHFSPSQIRRKMYEAYLVLFDYINNIINAINENVDLSNGDLTALQEAKVNISDIVDNLNSNDSDKPLSAKQGKELLRYISELTAGTVIMRGDYDTETGELVLYLRGGGEARIPILAMFDQGLVSESEMTSLIANYYTKTETDTLLGGKLDKSGGTMTGELNFSGNGEIIMNERNIYLGGGFNSQLYPESYINGYDGEVSISSASGIHLSTGANYNVTIERGHDTRKAVLLDTSNLTTYRNIKFPDKAGTLALTSDVTDHTSLTNNPHSVTKSQVGLGNVDNTSDTDKPVSTAQQTALDAKLSKDTTSTYSVYGVSSAGTQYMYGVGMGANGGKIPQRDSNGQINVPQLPTNNEHATSKKYVDDADTSIREVAEGKCKSYVVSYADNASFNTNNASISGVTSFKDINNNTISTSTLKNGDVVLVVETDVPDRWFSSSDSKFYKLETAKVDLTDINAHLLNTSNPHSVTATQVGLGNVVNTGDSATPTENGTTKFTTGGAYTELAKKVDKVSGKGLSTNDFTTEYKNAVDANSTAKHSHSNKTVLDNTTASFTDASYVHTDNNYTTSEKEKLAGIATGAEVNVIETVKVNGTALTPSSKAVDITVPTNTNQLTNGAGFITSNDIPLSLPANGGTADLSSSLYFGTISSTSSFVDGLSTYFNQNKTYIPREKEIAIFTNAYGNGSLLMGGFISGYDNNPYGGFFVNHYDTPRYIGISNGTYTEQTIITSATIGSYAVTDVSGKLDKSGDTMTGTLQVNAPIFAYNYTNGNSKPAIVLDKPSSNFTGIGAHGTNDVIWFGACSYSNGQASWVDDYKQKWHFNGTIIEDGTALSDKYLQLTGGTLSGSLEINSTGSSWSEGIRIHPATNDWSGIVLCEKSNSGATGTSAKTWSIHNHEGVFGAYKNGSDISSVSVGVSHDGSNWSFKGGDIYVNSSGRLAYVSEIPTAKYVHNITVSYSTSLFVTFSLVTNSSTKLNTYSALTQALYDAGFTSIENLKPANGQASASSKTRMIVGVYNSSSNGGQYLYYKYIDIVSTNSTTATINTSVSASSTYISISSATIYDTVEEC